MIFDKRQTFIAKGMATLMLLWHHLFGSYSIFLDKVISLLSFKGIPVECIIASFCKICVAIFVLLSGYGLYKSYNKKSNDYTVLSKNQKIIGDITFVKNHLIKIMFDFWLVYIIFVIMGIFFNHNGFEIYRGNFLYFLIDFFGFSYLFNTPSLNETWWFMSIILIYYLFFPIFLKLFKYSAEVFLSLSFLLIFIPYVDARQLNVWLFSFVLGMYISKYNLFELLSSKLNTIPKSIFFTFFALCVVAFIRFVLIEQSVVFDGLFSIPIILLCYLLISKIKLISNAFCVLGKYSGYIFMFHTFIFEYYFYDFIYEFKYPVLIYIVMIIVCIVFAFTISWIKKLTQIERLENKLIRR